MIELKNVSKTYDGVSAADRISLRIEQEASFVIAGPSGSGKTTLLRMIAGLEPPDSGEIFINGQKVSDPGRIIIPPQQRGAGMVFQDAALWPHMTVFKNLEFGLTARGLKKSERNQKIKDIAAAVKLNGHLNRYPASLSGGEKQRAAIARTLILEPRIMLMDEPLSGLDTVLKEELREMIARLVKRLKIVLVYVTHDRNDALAIADKIMVMAEGTVIQTGTSRELAENPGTDFVRKFMATVNRKS